jgi:C4-dicarboxylate transporter
MMMMLISLVYLLAFGMAVIASENTAIVLLFVSAVILLGVSWLSQRDEPEEATSTADGSSDLADMVSARRAGVKYMSDLSRQEHADYVTHPHPRCPRCNFSGYDPARPCNACGYSGGVSINT